MVGREAEEGGISKHGAKMITAMASARRAEIHAYHRERPQAAGYCKLRPRFKPHAMNECGRTDVPRMGPGFRLQIRSPCVKDDQGKREAQAGPMRARAYRAPGEKTFEDFANAYNFARNTWCTWCSIHSRPNVWAIVPGRLPQQEHPIWRA